MPFDWFTKPSSSHTVADLVREKKYKKALEQLRREFDKGNRSLELRIQYADVLAKAGDHDKAVPVLLGLASELDAAGSHEQALETLRQAERLEPGRADVAARQRALAARASRREATPDATGAATGQEKAKPMARPTPAEAPPPRVSAVTSCEPPLATTLANDASVENDAVLLFAGALAPPNFAVPEPAAPAEPAIQVEPEIPAEAEVPCELAPVEAPPAATLSDEALDAALGAALAEAEGASVDEGRDGSEALLPYVQEIIGRFPASGQEAAGPSELAGALFGGLSKSDLRGLLPGLSRLHFAPGQPVVREGERSGGVFILTRGRARVLVQGEHSRPFEVAELEEGSFFGEISLLARPRSATVVAEGPCEVLEIAQEALENLAEGRPRVRQIVENALLERTNSLEVAAVRAVPPMEPAIPAQAVGVLDAHFGARGKDPNTRLRLADVLARAGNYVDVVPVLVGLAEEMQAAGQRAHALAILLKIELIDHQGPKEVGIAPLTRAPRVPRREGPGAVLAYVTTGQPAPSAEAAAHFRRWLQELMDEAREARAADSSDSPFPEVEDADLGGASDSGPLATAVENGVRA